MTLLRLFLRAGEHLLLALILLTLLGPLRAQNPEEKSDYYARWLQQDVVYIITSEERDVFEKLSTPEEKDQFIEQFWARRDTDRSTAYNEFKEEHYRRLAYVNEHFHSGIPGWKSDRGKIYIKYGPPTGIERHPEGGTYARKPEEGGGITYTYPFEVWFYNQIEGVGEGIEIEFVDYSRTHEYRIARDSDQKDALLNVPGGGQTLAESLGLQTRLQRLRVRGLGNPDGGTGLADQGHLRPLRYRDYPFQKLAELYKLQSAPLVRYDDLQRLVTTRINYDVLPLDLRIDRLQAADAFSVVPVTLYVPNHELAFEPLAENSDVLRATLELFGQLSALSGKIIYSFEESIERRIPSGQPHGSREGYSAFQRSFPLQPGRYKLTLALRDAGSGKTALVERAIIVPTVEADQLQSSSVILTRQVTQPAEATIGEPFVVGKYRVEPARTRAFRVDQEFAQAYFEVYNLEVDQKDLKPSPKIEIALKQGAETIFDFVPIHQEFEFDQDRLVVFKTIPFEGLKPGPYSLQFRITDQISGRTLSVPADFEIRP